MTDSTKSILSTCLDETTSHQTHLEQLDHALTETTHHMTEFITTHGTTHTFLETVTSLEQKLRTLEKAKSYIKALLVSSELR